jgi:hypothetical protein
MNVLQQQRPETHVQTPVRRSRLAQVADQQVLNVVSAQAETESEFSYVPPELAKTDLHPEEVASVIQIWECTVLEFDAQTESMRAHMNAKIGNIDDHVADIDMEWVSPQDMDLVAPGAVFYLTLSRKLTRGRSIVNSQELRFRRLPAWSKKDAEKILKLGEDLYAKFAKPLTSA